MIKFFFAGFSILLIFAFLAKAEEVHGIVVSGGITQPVANVLVSAGNSQFTTTDSSGKFSLTFTPSGIITSRKSIKQMNVFWNCTSRILDLKNAPSINEISLYRLDGKQLYKGIVLPRMRLLHIPDFSSGIYILQLKGNNNLLYTCKLSSTSKIITFTLSESLQKNVAAASSVELNFKHDDYYPQHLDLTDLSDDLVISLKKDPRSEVFNQQKIHSYFFTITKDDSLIMEKNALNENYIPAVFQFDDSLYGQVGFRFKGSDYSLPNCFETDSVGVRQIQKPECLKVSFKVKFNEYDSTTRFYSMKALNLHSMSADGSKIHDMLSYGLFRDMGIFAPRSAYAKLYINGVFQGLFAAIEKIDGRFTKSRWPESGDGNLYKEAWPKSIYSDTYRNALETNNEDYENANVAKMVNLAKAVKSSTEQTFAKNVDSLIDLNYLLRYMVVDRSIKNWDGITAFYSKEKSTSGTNHNFYFYEDEAGVTGGKVWLIPWDMDNTFFFTDPYIDDAEVPNWNETPASCSAMPVWDNTGWVVPSNCDLLLKYTAATQWNKFVKFSEEYITTLFTTTRLQAKIDQYSSLIDSVVKQDPVINYNTWLKNVSSLRSAISGFRADYDNYVHGRNSEFTDTSDYSTPFPGSGKLLITPTNNFEFTTGPTSGYSNTFQSEGSIINLIHNSVNPLWGTADLQANFTFNPVDDDQTYSEWANFTLQFASTPDFTDLKEIKINLSSDTQRNLRVYLSSPVYSRHNVSVEYGWNVTVSPTNKIFTLKMSNISYPSWGKPDDPDLLDSVLTSSTSLGFNPGARFTTAGELKVVPDSGFLKVDNIKFVF